MTADILSIGDELLIGQTLNTNAHWMAERLTRMGIRVRHILTISDEADDIRNSLDDTLQHSDIVLITGGLGPTSDDITRDVLAAYFDSPLVRDEAVAERNAGYFKTRERKMTASVEDLARVPEKAETLQNRMGTAPGALYHENGRVVVSMPGVPYEMKAMMEEQVLPWLRDHFELPVILTRHILTAGRGESYIADKIEDIEKELDERLRIAYLPGVGMVKLRLTARGGDRHTLQGLIVAAEQRILERIGHYVYGYDGDSLEASIGRSLRDLGLSLATAESCTGGNISRIITSVPGSSDYYAGSVISYSNAVKRDVLGVPVSDLEEHGAVSEPVVRAMIRGAVHVMKTDLAIAVSGIAGPDGGTEDKPVGTVYIGVGTAENQLIRRFEFTTDRKRNIGLSSVVALVMLRKFVRDVFVSPGKKE